MVYLQNSTEIFRCEFLFFLLLFKDAHRISHHYRIGSAYDSWAMQSAALPHVMQDILLQDGDAGDAPCKGCIQ